MSVKVAIIRTGSANLASVVAAFERLGARCRLTQDPTVVREAAALVLPGVGAFGAAMSILHDNKLVDPFVERAAAGRPVLAICLGLQLLARESEETPGVSGLGVIDARIERFTGPQRVPQMGWNEVMAEAGCAIISTGQAYFANSYRLTTPPANAQVAWTEYGGRFIAAFERGNLLACQFHPELSGPWGSALLNRWLARVGAVTC